MDRIYLDKTNVNNKFQFYQKIQSIINIYLLIIKVEKFEINKKFRSELYEQFIKKNILGIYITADWIGNNIQIAFSLKSEQGERNFGNVEIELNRVMQK